MLRESNIREGFFEHREYLAVRNDLPDAIKPVMIFGYLTRWCISEILSLRWKQVDLNAGSIRVDPGKTKGGEGRTIYLEGELKEVMAEQNTLRRLDCPFVFHRSGRQIRDFRWAWDKATTKNRIKGMLFHDLRRSAVRNLEHAGVPRSVAMKLTGHKTEAVYRRYAIVSEADLSEGVKKLAALNGAKALFLFFRFTIYQSRFTEFPAERVNRKW